MIKERDQAGDKETPELLSSQGHAQCAAVPTKRNPELSE